MQLAVKKTEIDFEAMFENGIYEKKIESLCLKKKTAIARGQKD